MNRGAALAALSFGAVAWASALILDSVIVAAVAVALTAVVMVLIVRNPARKQRVPSSPRFEGTPHGAPQVGMPGFDAVSPISLEPRSVVRSLLESGTLMGEAVAAHLWLQDVGSGSLRLVVSDGPMAPSDRPLGLDDSTLGAALAQGVARIDEVTRFTSIGTGTTVITRVSLPVVSGDIRGVAGLDFAGTPPSGEAATTLGTAMRLPLAAALTLHRSQVRTDEAVSLIDAARELSEALSPEAVLSLTLKRAMHIAGAGTGSIMLLNQEAGELSISLAVGLPDEVVNSTVVRVGEGIAGWVAASAKPLLIEDLPGSRSAGGHRHGVRSAVSVPLGDEHGTLGVINVGSRTFPARFTQEHLQSLELLGQQAAVALRNARAVTSAGEIYFDTLRTLALALESKDPYAAGGTDRVLEFSSATARAMQLSPDEVRAVEIAAMLHDIGMSSLSGIGTDSRPLTTMERGLLKMHPTIAADILEQAPALAAVAPIVYHHHEHYDGSGYVTGLAGSGIPLGARILSVADAYVAMTSDRAYRRAMTPSEAAAELSQKAGTQFDPDVVSVFLGLLGSGTNRVPGRNS